MKPKRAIRSLASAVILLSIQDANAVDISFNGGSELATLFNVSTFADVGWTAGITQVSFGGVLNSGAVDVVAVNSPAEATYKMSSYDFSQSGSALFASIFFKFQNVNLPPANSRNLIQLGFVDNPNGRFTFNNNDMSVFIGSNSSGTTQLFTEFGGGGIGLAANLGLVDGNWYRLSGTFVNQTSVVRITASIDSYGTMGTSLVNHLSTFTWTRSPDGNILTDSTVWLAFEASSSGGTDLIDNLSAIPEPDAMGLFVLAGGFWFWKYRTGGNKTIALLNQM